MGDEIRSDLRALAYDLFDKLGLEVAEEDGVKDSVRLYTEHTGSSKKDGSEAVNYLKEVPCYTPAEGEPDIDQRVVAGLLELPEAKQKEGMRAFFEKGPFFELLSYRGSVNVLMLNYVDSESTSEMALGVIVEEDRVQDYLAFLKSTENVYSQQIADKLSETIKDSREDLDVHPDSDLSRKADVVAEDFEAVKDFVMRNLDFL
jgi:hypothetical protein